MDAREERRYARGQQPPQSQYPPAYMPPQTRSIDTVEGDYMHMSYCNGQCGGQCDNQTRDMEQTRAVYYDQQQPGSGGQSQSFMGNQQPSSGLGGLAQDFLGGDNGGKAGQLTGSLLSGSKR